MTKLTVIIPVYNEVATFPVILERIRALPVDKEIVVVDNVSTDGTRAMVTALDGEDGVQVILQQVNRGKGDSVRKGIQAARGEYLVIQDADLEYEPAEILGLLSRAELGADAVFGSRLLGERPRVPLHHALGRDLLNVLFNVLYGSRITDVATCYKLIRTAVAQSLVLRSVGFDLDYEIACRLRRAGVAIVELPVTYRPRTLEEGKKLRWTDGLRAMLALLRFRVSR